MDEVTVGREVNRAIGAGYRLRVQWLPYQLADSEKAQMRDLFERVMAPLAFKAAPAFVDNLFGTSLLMRVFSRTGELAAFGNIRVRPSGGLDVRHILAVYVSPDHRGHELSVRAIEAAILEETWRNALCILRPLYITGSAVNPMVVKSLARRTDLWPDLLKGRAPTPQVSAIARDAAAYYPVRGASEFQVSITPEYAIVEDSGVIQRTGDPQFDKRFFEIACPEERKLLLFVARVRFRHVAAAVIGRCARWVRQSRSSAVATSRKTGATDERRPGRERRTAPARAERWEKARVA
jgi:hypothetical protein